MGQNVYYNAGNKYITTGAATLYAQTGGQHQWYYAASGTAGNAISFSQGMLLDSSGNLLINTTANANSAKLKSKVSAGAVGFEVTDESSSDFVVIPAVSASVCKIGPTAGALAIQTAGTERMRIDTSGALCLNTTSVIDSGILQVAYASGVNNGIIFRTNGTGSQYAAIFNNGNGLVGSITTNASATAYNTSSDYRLKENIAPITNALATVAQLKPVTYNWKVDGTNGQGFIAHELAEVVPDCVTGEKDAIDKDGKPQYQGVDTSFLVATLTKAIQEQQALIESLTTRLNALENK
jgi:hypothetical protein